MPHRACQVYVALHLARRTHGDPARSMWHVTWLLSWSPGGGVGQKGFSQSPTHKLRRGGSTLTGRKIGLAIIERTPGIGPGPGTTVTTARLSTALHTRSAGCQLCQAYNPQAYLLQPLFSLARTHQGEGNPSRGMRHLETDGKVL